MLNMFYTMIISTSMKDFMLKLHITYVIYYTL